MEGNSQRSPAVVVAVVLIVALTLLTAGCLCLFVPLAVVRRSSPLRGLAPWRLSGPWPLNQVEVTESVSGRYDVGAPLTLEVQVGVGDVRIEAGDGSMVEVRATKHAWGAGPAQAEARLRDFHVNITQAGSNRVSIEADGPRPGEARSPRVDLVITVPRQADVRAVVNVGAIAARGVQGSLDLATNVGEVRVDGVTLTGSSRLAANVGSVTANLPADSSFELDARTSVGSVSCGFDLQGQNTDNSLVGKSLHGRVGTAPMTLTVHVNTGDIHIEPVR